MGLFGKWGGEKAPQQISKQETEPVLEEPELEESDFEPSEMKEAKAEKDPEMKEIKERYAKRMEKLKDFREEAENEIGSLTEAMHMVEANSSKRSGEPPAYGRNYFPEYGRPGNRKEEGEREHREQMATNNRYRLAYLIMQKEYEIRKEMEEAQRQLKEKRVKKLEEWSKEI